MRTPDNPHCARLIATAREVIAQLPDEDVTAAFLFGSAAWGDADATSDLDLMLLLERPADYREVTRLRVPELLGRPLPDGPAFADLDRLSAARFAEITAQGGWVPRVIHSVVLKDTDGWYTGIRDRVTATHATPAARAARWQRHVDHATTHRTAMWELRDTDPPLAALHARLAIAEALAGLIELNGGRISLTHFIESAGRALRHFDAEQHAGTLQTLLGLDATTANTAGALQAYRRFADALASWMGEPDVHDRLSPEDRAWARFTYAPETYEEMAHKIAAFTALGRLPALQYYLDGLLLVVVRLNLGKVLHLREHGAAAPLSEPEFHVALRAEPALLRTWIDALRLDQLQDQLPQADTLTSELVRIGSAALGEPT